MTDEELYTLIVNDPKASKYVDDMKLNLLYKYIRYYKQDSGEVTMSQLVTFLQQADIEPFPDRVIPNELFKDDANMKQFDFSNIDEVGEMAFYQSGLMNANLASVKKVGTGAFYNTQITELKLNGVESIGSYAFFGNKKLEELYIPDMCYSIGEGAFSGCTNLKTIAIDFSTTDKPRAINNDIFKGCKSLEELYMHEGSIIQFNEVIKTIQKNNGTIYIIKDGMGTDIKNTFTGVYGMYPEDNISIID